MITIGIIPGVYGAMCFYNEELDKIDFACRMPMLPTTKDNPKFSIDVKRLIAIIQNYEYRVLRVVIESPSLDKNGQNANQMFKFGCAVGYIVAICTMLNFEIVYASQYKWKSAMGVGKDKSAVVQKVIERFPDAAKFFTQKQDYKRSEATLLALFGALKSMRSGSQAGLHSSFE